jgi:lipoate-protein ligase A
VKTLHWIDLRGVSIFEQLQLEEMLLRTDPRSFCLVNQGSLRSIVLGISSKPEELVDLQRAKKDKIPLIKRFSGGGTVIVDEQTLFITFIFAKEDLSIPSFPEPILRWSADIYQEAWKIPGFALRENDYVIGDRKCGGNAQYIQKERWVHHTSFLWDFVDSNMDYLLLPAKRPSYRQDRSHQDFLTSLKCHAKSSDALISSLKKTLVKRFYITPFEMSSLEKRTHRKAVCQIA